MAPSGNPALYQNGKHWVEKAGDRFLVCDQEGCSRELYHSGDDYATLEEAKTMVDFWQSGGHWSNRPDTKGNR